MKGKNIYSYIDDFYKTKENDFYAYAKLKYILKHVPKDKKLKILDLGCGSGEATIELAKLGHEVVAVDIYSNALKYTRRRLEHNKLEKKVKLIRSSLNKLKLDNFDVIIAQDIIEHIKDDVEALRKLSKMLKEEGVLIITVPALMFLWGKHDEYNGHYRRYSKKELMNKSKKFFKIAKIHYWGFLSVPITLLISRLLKKRYNFDVSKPETIIHKIMKAWFMCVENKVRFPIGTCLFAIMIKK